MQAVRTKRDSSMHVGLRLVKDKRAVGFVTAGNTGAAMAVAKMVLGALPGVDRPALANVFPTSAGKLKPSILIDVGANVDSKPHNLAQFALMGEMYYRAIFKKAQAHSRAAFRWRRRRQRQRSYAQGPCADERPAA